MVAMDFCMDGCYGFLYGWVLWISVWMGAIYFCMNGSYGFLYGWLLWISEIVAMDVFIDCNYGLNVIALLMIFFTFRNILSLRCHCSLYKTIFLHDRAVFTRDTY